MSEIWVAIPNYEGAYEVSNLGRVKSLQRMVNNSNPNTMRSIRTKILSTKGKKYKMVSLSIPNKRRRAFCVHELVLLVFSGPRPEGYEGRHLDGNRDNNHISNLKWGTPKENCDDRLRHGRMARGSKNGMSKLTAKQILEIKHLIDRGIPLNKIAERFGISSPHISDIKNGKRWGWLE